MIGYKRTHTCGELRKSNEGNEVLLTGWVGARRDLGGLIFISLRDRYGVTQIIFDPNSIESEFFKEAEKLRYEFVISVKGRVRSRPSDQIRADQPTGEIEIEVFALEILNESRPMPFEITDDVEASEDLRLKYRYLDLRRPELQRTLELRSKVAASIRSFFVKESFIEVETPVLTKSTPEGARDFLVPSRVHAGKFYALPQSPQLFKQLLMLSGMDRYFQIVKCYRDEDLRADRQPEFTQIDCEMSFVEPDDIFDLIERMLFSLYKEVMGVEIKRPFDRLDYADAISQYGTDKPDRRISWKLVEITDALANTSFNAFLQIVQSKGVIKALNVKGIEKSRKELDELAQAVKSFGLDGLSAVKVTKEGWKSSLAKFFSDEEKREISAKLNLEEGDLFFIAAGRQTSVNAALSDLRLKLGKQHNAIDKDKLDFLWVVNFPLFQWSDDEERFVAAHHPFTSPRPDQLESLKKSAEGVIAQAYDIVLNGYELGSGSIRNHREDVQRLVFKQMGIGDEEANQKFGFLLNAFGFGAPPHGGIALGLDRIIMLMAGRDSIRDVIAFPKTASASCLMTDAPSDVSKDQLEDLHLSILP